MIVAPSLEAFRRQWEREIVERRQARARPPPAVAAPEAANGAVRAASEAEADRGSDLEHELGALPFGESCATVAGLACEEEAEDPAGFVPRVPAELVVRVLSHLGDASSLARASQVCRRWHGLARDAELWRKLCWELWRSDPDLVAELFASYQSSWFRMRCRRPFLRFDGVYCSKVSYVRRGVAEWTFNTPVHTVIYYRYLRFFPDGSVVSATSFDQPFRPSEHSDSDDEQPHVRHPKSADVSWLMRPERVGAKLPRATVLGGVFSTNRQKKKKKKLYISSCLSLSGSVSAAVRCQRNVSTFSLTLRLHRSRRRHLLQWLEFGQVMDAAPERRHSLELALAEAPMFIFVRDDELL